MILDNAVPARVIGALRTEIIASPPKSDGTHWYGFATPPRLLFEQTIQHLRRLVPNGDEFVGAEWWYRASWADTGFPFHFDRDEGIRHAVVSPGLISVLYLGRAGGPTVFVNATPARISAPTRGFAVTPRPGRFAVFPGTQLHGVLPAHPSPRPRVTMLINWWRERPRMESAPKQRGWTSAEDRWRSTKTRPAALEPIDPTALMSKAAWRDLIRNQASYR